MGGVIVHDNVDVEAIRNLRVDLFKKIEKLGGSVALVTVVYVSGLLNDCHTLAFV